MKAILNGKAVVEMLRDFGLSEYEARMYFVLLTLGESRVGALTKRACVPQSKGYEVMDRLIEKGFAEQTNGEKPKTYRAKTLQKVASKVIAREQRFIKRLNSNFTSLQRVVEAISPVYEKYGAFRLFSPIFSRRQMWMRVNMQRVPLVQELDGRHFESKVVNSLERG
jgi:sugar-specific transcriptional regulator TrmB